MDFLLAELKTSIEQLRDIFYTRSTYDNDDEWLDNLDCCLLELCQQVGLDTVQQHNQRELSRTKAVMEIGNIVIDDIQKSIDIKSNLSKKK